MKVRIEIVDSPGQEEVVIRCKEVGESVGRLQRYAARLAAETQPLVFYKDEEEFYFPPGQVLFFETEGEVVYAHTETDAFRIRHRLYELEDMLPRAFVRVAKSTIVNTRQIYSIQRELAAASLIKFAGTHKQVYASRRYLKELKLRMQERRMMFDD